MLLQAHVGHYVSLENSNTGKLHNTVWGIHEHGESLQEHLCNFTHVSTSDAQCPL